MSGPIKKLTKSKFKLRKKLPTAGATKIATPMYMGSLKPEILFVVDPVVGPANADNPPNIKRPLPPKQFEFLTEHCKRHGIPRNKAAILWAAPPVTAYTWSSAKRTGDHLKLHREDVANRIRAANPKLIVAMGKSAATQVANRAVAITKVRGTPEHNNEFDCLVFPSLGVAHVIRQPDNQRTFEADFATLKKICDTGYTLKYQDDIKQDYRWVTNLKAIKKVVEAGPVTLSVDTEYTGGEYFQKHSKLLTVQIATGEGKAYCIPWDYNHVDHGLPVSKMQKAKIRRQLKYILEHPNASLVGHQFKGDVIWLRHKMGIDCAANYADDTICLTHGVDENIKRKDLDEVTRQFVPAMAGYADAFNRDPVHLQKTRMDLVPPDLMLMYGCGDVDASLRCYHTLTEELKKDKKNYRCYKEVVMPAMRAFSRIEDHGFCIDRKALKIFEIELRKHQDKEYKRIRKMVPKEIADVELADKWRKKDKNGVLKPASLTRPGLLISWLFKHKKGLRLTPVVFTKSTKNEKDPKDRVPSTSGKNHLAYFKEDHEVIEPLMDYIQNEKLLGTYIGSDDGDTISGFYRYIMNNRIRPVYHLHRTVTGRSASSNPNGQNFPKRGKLAKRYREIFIAPPGYVLLEVDFSQMELRIAAVMAGDPTMLELYRNGADIHAATAAATMGITLEEFNKLDPATKGHKRFQAKAINFGFLYGMGWRKFITYAKTEYGVEFTEEEAQNIQRAFFRLYRKLKPWHNKMVEWVREHGWVRALDGRLRHLPSVYSPDEAIAAMAERQAINSPVQAFGSDLGLMALHQLVSNIPFDLVRPIGFIHDALVCIAPEAKAKEAAAAIKYWMEHVPLKKMFNLELPVPIIAEAAVGKNLSKMIEISDDWYDDKKLDSYKSIVIKDWEIECAKAEKKGETPPPHPYARRHRKLVVKRKLRAITPATKKPLRKLRKAA